MSKWIVDIHGNIEGDYELIGKYVEPKTGHWIEIANNRGTVIALRCSCCGKSPKHAIKSDFCPNCGARMIELSEDKE